MTSQPSVAPPPIKYTSLCWEGQRLSAKSKIAFEILQHIKQSRERLHQQHLPPPCTTVRAINFLVLPRVKMMHCTEIKIENLKSAARKGRAILISGSKKYKNLKASRIGRLNTSCHFYFYFSLDEENLIKLLPWVSSYSLTLFRVLFVIYSVCFVAHFTFLGSCTTKSWK